jgi:hypothetical protein
MYAEILANLRHEIAVEGARPSVIDIGVQKLLNFSNDALAADLLALLSDSAQYDEGMFTLIHTAETSDNVSYVSAVITVFPDLAISSPRWASIVLMRTLNNHATLQALILGLGESSDIVKSVFLEICQRINRVRPELSERTLPLIQSVS